MHKSTAFPSIMAGIYIHIPFCARRCVYCGFYSTTSGHLKSKYVQAVGRELRLRRAYLGNEPVRTVYVGGGTPSQLNIKQLEALFDAVSDAAPHPSEVTVECNPDDVTPTLAESLAAMGVNRVSMGIQSFSDERLTLLHRRHDSTQAHHAVALMQAAGFENISIDLMFGFPGQSLSAFESDIDEALRLGVTHISAYSLMFEEDTPLYRQLQEGLVNETDEETSRVMYDVLCRRLTAAGYEHYEISNFALPGYRSQHNSSYWDGTPYLGLGAAAHSYDGKSRQWNVADVETYISAIGRGEVPCEQETLDAATRINDRITTALRTCEGLDLDLIARTEGVSYTNSISRSALPHLHGGLLRKEGSHLILTHEGIHLSDLIMSDLMIV